MNAGQYLVSKSPLSSGTALAHLLAMQTGGVRTVFASQMAVCLEAPQTTVVQRPSDHSVKTTHHTPGFPVSADPTNVAEQPSSLKAITAKQQHSQLAVTSRQESIYIAQKTHASTFVRTLPNTISARRKRIVKQIS